MLTIYGANLSGPANKVRFVANALSLDYEYRQVNLRAGEHRSEEYLKLNPSGKVPVIEDDGFVCFESNAIIKYLADKHKSSFYPQDLQKRAILEQWLDFCSIHVGAAVNRVVFNRIMVPFIRAEVDERSLKDGLGFLQRFLPVVNHRLEQTSYLAGDELTLADFNLLSVLDPCEAAEIDLSAFAAIVKWRSYLQEQDFYTRCHKSYADALEALRAAAQR